MKPILKSAKNKTNHQFVKSELFFEVKPYTQTAVFSEKNPQENIESNEKSVNPKKKDELEDLDRNEVHNLEKWIDYNKHKQISSIFNEVKLKKLEREKKLKEMSGKTVKESYYRFPEIRPNIINAILDQEKHICVNDKNNEMSKRKFFKSFETIKNDANKMIVNELIYKKVSDKMRINTANSGKEKFAYTIPSMNPTQNTEPNVEPELTTNTINNFKHLQQLFVTYKQDQIINYPDLFARIQQANQTVEKLFEYTEEIKKLNDISKRNLDYEADLLEEFDALKKKIQEKKLAQKKIRMQNASNNSKLAMQNETNDRIRFRLQNNFDSVISKAQKASIVMWPKGKGKEEPNQGSAAYTIEEFMQIQRINEEKEKTEKMIKGEIEKIKSEMKTNNSNLELIEKEVNDLRQKKIHYQLELKDIYLTRLKEELSQEKNESITWIVKAFNRIDKEFTNENFPHDLDEDNINYLYKMAQFEQELIDLRTKQRYEIVAMTQKGDKNLKLLNREYGARIEEIRNKLKFMKKEKFQISKTTSNKVQYRSTVEKKLEEEMMEDYFKKCLGDLDIADFEQKESRDNLRNGSKNYEIQIKNKIELLDQTKKNEIFRLFHKFKHVSNEDSDFGLLLRILRILFGAKKVNDILVAFDKFKDDIRNKDIGLSSVEKIRPKTSRSHSEFARLKSAKSTGGISKNKEQKEEMRKDYEEFFNKITIDSQAVNYKYNLNYNYTPTIENYQDNATFFTKSRVQTAKSNKRGINF